MFMTGGLHWYKVQIKYLRQEGRSDRQPVYERLLDPWGNDADC